MPSVKTSHRGNALEPYFRPWDWTLFSNQYNVINQRFLSKQNRWNLLLDEGVAMISDEHLWQEALDKPVGVRAVRQFSAYISPIRMINHSTVNAFWLRIQTIVSCYCAPIWTLCYIRIAKKCRTYILIYVIFRFHASITVCLHTKAMVGLSKTTLSFAPSYIWNTLAHPNFNGNLDMTKHAI